MDLWPLGPWGGRAGEEVSFTRGHSQVTCPAPPSSLLAGLPLREAASKGGHAGEAAGTRTHAGLAGSEGWVATSIGQGPSRRLHIRTLYCSHTQGPSKAATSPEERATTATRKYLASSLGSAGRREEPSTVDGRCSSDRGGGGSPLPHSFSASPPPLPFPPPLLPGCCGHACRVQVHSVTIQADALHALQHAKAQGENLVAKFLQAERGEEVRKVPHGGSPPGGPHPQLTPRVPVPVNPQRAPPNLGSTARHNPRHPPLTRR